MQSIALPESRSDFLPSKYNGRKSLLRKEDEYKQNYVVFRINLEAIEVNWRVRNAILHALDSGVKFVQVGQHTIMLNSIASIDPMKKKKPPKKGRIINNVFVVEE